MEAWSRCSPAEQVTTDSCGISLQRVDKILFYSILPVISAFNDLGPGDLGQALVISPGDLARCAVISPGDLARSAPDWPDHLTVLSEHIDGRLLGDLARSSRTLKDVITAVILAYVGPI